MKHTLFLGNGLNLLSGYKDWNALLSSLSDESLLSGIPNTLQYECIMLKKDYSVEAMLTNEREQIIVNENGSAITFEANSETLVKYNISRALKSIIYNAHHVKLIEMPFEHYITSNYDDAINRALQNKGFNLSNSNHTEKIYSLRRREQYTKDDEEKVVWKMHGDINHPSSIMLGLDHYCGSVGKIDDYLKGSYRYGKENILPDMIKRLKGNDNGVYSWIDLFFTTDVYIMGFGLDYSEIDLWWLLNRRKRYIRKYGRGLVRNSITFYGDVDGSKKALLQSLDVNVEVLTPENRGYERMYDRIIQKIEENINTIGFVSPER